MRRVLFLHATSRLALASFAATGFLAIGSAAAQTPSDDQATSDIEAPTSTSVPSGMANKTTETMAVEAQDAVKTEAMPKASTKTKDVATPVSNPEPAKSAIAAGAETAREAASNAKTIISPASKPSATKPTSGTTSGNAASEPATATPVSATPATGTKASISKSTASAPTSTLTPKQKSTPAPAPAPAPAKAPLIGDLRKSVAADYKANLEPLFKHFHANPELSFKESKTAQRLNTELTALGYDVTMGVGGTGLVAVMKNGDGPTVMMRADMDGLPVEEKSGLAYASKARQVDIDGVEKPVMHACGHDVHITALVGTARQMAARKTDWSGTLLLIAQPAEERVGGAKAMLDDGLYTRFPKPEYALAFHVAADLPAGKIEIKDKLVASSADSVNITVRGIGAHGAGPHKGVDPILVASHIVVALQSVVSRSLNPLDPGVITVGSFHGGFKHNIISDNVELQLTVRSNRQEVRDQLIAGIRRTAAGVASGLGVPDNLAPIVEVGFESTPPTINDPQTAQLVRGVFQESFGQDGLVVVPPEGMGAEDFAYFVTPDTGVKGVYFAVGGTAPGDLDTAAGHHSPLFKVQPEPSVTVGVEAMTRGAMALMKKTSL